MPFQRACRSRGIICILQLTFFIFFKYRVYLCSVKEMEILLCGNRSTHKIKKYVCQRIDAKFCYISEFQEICCKKLFDKCIVCFGVYSQRSLTIKAKRLTRQNLHLYADPLLSHTETDMDLFEVQILNTSACILLVS